MRLPSQNLRRHAGFAAAEPFIALAVLCLLLSGILFWLGHAATAVVALVIAAAVLSLFFIVVPALGGRGLRARQVERK